MNSKFLVLTGALLFTFGCSHTTLEVAQTDIPEDDIIAGEPVAPRPTRAVATVDPSKQEVGYSDFSQPKKKHVTTRRGLASVDEGTGEAVAQGGNSNPQDESSEHNPNIENATPPADPSEDSRENSESEYQSSDSKHAHKCNTMAYAKQRLGVTEYIGNAGGSMPVWLRQPGYQQISAAEATRPNDFCIFAGGHKGFGTIIMKDKKGWGDGCGTYSSLPHPRGYALKGCVRPSKQANN